MRKAPWLWPAVLTGGLAPLAVLLVRASQGTLGADAVAVTLNQLGLLALIFLVLSLACTPLKILFGWTWPIALRKTLGLFAFFYACLHFSTYALIDQVGDVRAIVKDVLERKFIFVGFAALVALVPLAITSTSKMLKRMGAARWKRLHRLAYVAASLGVVHFILRVKKDESEPAAYAVVLAALFLVRLLSWARQRGASPARARAARPG